MGKENGRFSRQGCTRHGSFQGHRRRDSKWIGGSGRLRRGELRLQQTREESENIRCKAGTIMILPPNSLHAFYNKSSELCRLLGISTQLHQTFFDAVASADQEEPFSSRPFSEAMERIAQIGLQQHIYSPPHHLNTPPDAIHQHSTSI